MSEMKKRPWFRFHLLTLALVLIASGGLMTANAKNRLMAKDDGGYQWVGWPVMMYQRNFSYYPESMLKNKEDLDKALHDKDRNFYQDGIGVIEPSIWGWILHPQGAIVNLLSAVAILLVVALASESVLRRREARKT